MNKKYKHIFFDLDHTLWDFDKNSEYTLQKLYTDYNLKNVGIPDFKTFLHTYNAHNERLWARFRSGFIKRDELRWKRFWLTMLDFQIGDTVLANELSMAYLELLPTQTILTPHAKELLEYCNEHYSIHLITNGYELTQKMKLQFSGISAYFSEVFTSERCNGIKPHKEIFEFALSTTGAGIEESIMVGDALDVDILGAANVGMDQVYYNPTKMQHDRKPTYEVASLSELKSIF
ncbi:MAG: noncanonical pyrimidine nucleotidase, YjjG family [Chitinophagales bacterium]|nr:YjjG family noncanonical pyrimidine nucleotidase [Chitinophagaceae bacterium]MCB9063725.1 noncanonical pyrimidine nucleotidase, YjjG family [Chitinophagales bacterium]